MRDEDATRPITLPPLKKQRCAKPPESPCDFRDEDGFCTKRITTCPYLERRREE